MVIEHTIKLTYHDVFNEQVKSVKLGMLGLHNMARLQGNLNDLYWSWEQRNKFSNDGTVPNEDEVKKLISIVNQMLRDCFS